MTNRIQHLDSNTWTPLMFYSYHKEYAEFLQHCGMPDYAIRARFMRARIPHYASLHGNPLAPLYAAAWKGICKACPVNSVRTELN